MPTVSLSPNPATGKNYLIFPNGPFLLRTLALSLVASVRSFSSLPISVSTPLVLGVDYFPAFMFNSATGELGEAVYAGISLVDPLLEGILTYSFTAVSSGQYDAVPTEINAIYADEEINPLIARWEDVMPTLPTYPHTALTYDETHLTKIDSVHSAIAGLGTQAALASTSKSIFDFTAHSLREDNPHNDTAQATDLGNVPNWTVGTAASVIAGGSQQEYVTPLAIRNSVVEVVPKATLAILGTVELNVGTSPNDNINAVDGLTAAGLGYMLSNDLLTSGGTLVNNERQVVQFTPFPIVYPATWGGTVCNTFEELVIAVEQFTGIHNLTSNAKEGIVFFPRIATAPSLALS